MKTFFFSLLLLLSLGASAQSDTISLYGKRFRMAALQNAPAVQYKLKLLNGGVTIEVPPGDTAGPVLRSVTLFIDSPDAIILNKSFTLPFDALQLIAGMTSVQPGVQIFIIPELVVGSNGQRITNAIQSIELRCF
jgi:hypothetical protein